MFIRIKNTIVNINNILDITLDDDRIEIYLSTKSNEGTRSYYFEYASADKAKSEFENIMFDLKKLSDNA